METLYRMKQHVIAIDREKSIVSFLKEASIDNIKINSKALSFAVRTSRTFYDEKNIFIDDVKYNVYGEKIEIIYKSRDEKLELKEVYSYITDELLEHYFVILRSFDEIVEEFEIREMGIESEKDLELIVPSDFYIKKMKNGHRFNFENIEKEMALSIFRNNDINFINFYYGNDNLDLIIEKNSKNKYNLIYKLKINSVMTKDRVLGANYIILSKENYIENLEELRLFYEKGEKKPFEKLQDANNLKEIIGKKIFLDISFSMLIKKYVLGEILEGEFLELLKIDQALKESMYFSRIISSSFNEKNLKKEYEIYLFLALFLGTVLISEREGKYIYEYIEILKNNTELKDSKNYYNYIKLDGVFGFVKKTGEKNLIIAVNRKAMGSDSTVIFEKKRFEGIEKEICFLENILNNKVESFIKNFKSKIYFKDFDKKIMEIKSFTGEILECGNLEIDWRNNYIENLFYSIKIDEKIEIESKYAGKKILEIDLEKYSIDKEKMEIISKNWDLRIELGKENIMKMFFYNIKNGEIIFRKNRRVLEMIKRDDKSIVYSGETYCKIESSDGIEMKDSEYFLEIKTLKNEMILEMVII